MWASSSPIWCFVEKNKLVLITGATGHSGRYAIERLAARKAEDMGFRFRVLVRESSDVSFIQSCGLPMEVARGDILDDAALERALLGADVLLNIFGIICDPARVTRMALAAGVRRVISVHTTGVYSRFKNARKNYLESDRQVSELCRAAGADLTILRPTMIYGDVDDQNVITFIRMMDRFPVMPVVSGARFPLQPVHRRDLGYAYADVLLSGDATKGKNYALSGRDPILLRDMLTVIAGYLHKPARFLSVPFWLAYAGAWGVYLITLTKMDYREKVQRLVEPRAYSHEDASRDFGYAPMSFAEGVKDETAAYLAGCGR